jgi:hypothetical protein
VVKIRRLSPLRSVGLPGIQPLSRGTKRQILSTSDLLARLVLRNQAAWRRLGVWETRLLARRLAAVPLDRPVFIAGLARSGTTILLRKLCEMPEFASHRYADFPFLFTPYAWTRLSQLTPRRRETPRERMHRDGILVTSESPEAMEEVLWMGFFPHLHDPARANVLDAETSQPDFEGFFADHIRKLLLARGAPRYVSKNNYNVTRLGYLARIAPDARFLLTVRAPEAHVASLMKQHALFSRIQRDSEAAREQLRLRGHFEFGLDRRPINPGDDEAIAGILDCWQCGKEARGWARYWALIYRHIANTLAGARFAGRCLLVRHEDLCDRAVETLARICDHIGVPAERAAQLAPGLHAPDYYEPDLSDDDRIAIAEETGEAARRLGY